MKILVSRTDSIGDVILTLPLCGWIKKQLPDAEVHFLCQSLTVEIIKRSQFVDHIHVWDGALPDVDVIVHVFPRKEIARAAKKQKIKIRIGTSHRLFHLNTCNRLAHFSRIKSDLHEAQLNFKLLKQLGIDSVPTLKELATLTGWKSGEISSSPWLIKGRFNLIFHIKSRGSAKEWESSNYLAVAKELPEEKVNLILTGTKQEAELIRKEIPEIFDLKYVKDSTGKLSLGELISLVGNADGLLACSTGPLHIAGASNINCLGLYPKKRPMHAGRWGPLGANSSFLEESEESEEKYLAIGPKTVLTAISNWLR